MNGESNRFKEIRESLSLTQEEFAEKLNVSAATVRKIEGGANLGVQHAIRIHNLFGFSLDYIYGISDDTNDEASTMLLYLRKLFQYKVDDEYTFPHVLEISKPVFSFLSDYQQAEEFFNSGKIPEVAFTPWVQKLKADLNLALKDGSAETEEYCLVPKKDVQRKNAPGIRVDFTAPLGGSNYGKR